MIVGGLILENTHADQLKDTLSRLLSMPHLMVASFTGIQQLLKPTPCFTTKLCFPIRPTHGKMWRSLPKTFNKPQEGKYAIAWDVGNAYYSYIFLSAFGADLFGRAGQTKTAHGKQPEAVKGLAISRTSENSTWMLPKRTWPVIS